MSTDCNGFPLRGGGYAPNGVRFNRVKEPQPLESEHDYEEVPKIVPGADDSGEVGQSGVGGEE
jgi:hypothetical protein